VRFKVWKESGNCLRVAFLQVVTRLGNGRAQGARHLLTLSGCSAVEVAVLREIVPQIVRVGPVCLWSTDFCHAAASTQARTLKVRQRNRSWPGTKPPPFGRPSYQAALRPLDQPIPLALDSARRGNQTHMIETTDIENSITSASPRPSSGQRDVGRIQPRLGHRPQESPDMIEYLRTKPTAQSA